MAKSVVVGSSCFSSLSWRCGTGPKREEGGREGWGEMGWGWGWGGGGGGLKGEGSRRTPHS